MIIKEGRDIIGSYLEDNSGILSGSAEKVFIPESGAECASLIKDLYESGIPMTFSGAGTGMTGGRIPFEGVIVSHERLKKRELISLNGIPAIKTGAGASLADIKEFCRKQGLFFPVNPTEETATIGAAASNNSSGSWTYRYGSIRDNLFEASFITRDGIELKLTRSSPAFQGDSLRLDLLSSEPLKRPGYLLPNVKNAAGYYSRPDMPLIDMVTGAEGTLGFFHELVLKLMPVPAKVIECLFFFEKEKNAVDFVQRIRSDREKSSVLQPRALEFFNKNALDILREIHPQVPQKTWSAVIFEQELTDLRQEEKLLESVLEFSQDCGAMTDDAWIADTPQRLEELRLFRHSLPSLINERFKRNEFIKLSTDSSVPDDSLSEILGYYNAQIKESGLQSIIFGHIGNNHLHVNLLARKDEIEKAKLLYLLFMKKAVSLGGTISAEHGIGKLKKPFLPILFGEDGLRELKRIKLFFDPKNLFNKGNMFDL